MTLHDQLERLAERAEPAAGPTGGELWDRGTRHRRRMRRGTAAIAAGTLLGVAVLAGVSIGRAGPAPEPVPADAPAGLPSQLWEPSPWLPGSAEVGPPGQVVTVIEDRPRQSWTGSTYGVVAVSAATGDYRFLDLPDLALGDFAARVALSPDGRHLAYWTAGTPSDNPNTSTMSADRAITGLAVFDTDSGATRTHTVPTQHGLYPDTLAWAGPDTLVATYLQFQVGGREGFAAGGDTWIWDVRAEAPERATEPTLSTGSWGVPSNGRVLLTGRRNDRVLDGATLEVLATTRRVSHLESAIALSPDGTRLAGLWSRRPNVSRLPSPVAVAPIDDPAAAAPVRAGLKTYTVEGWTDDDHVAAVGDGGPDRFHSALLEVNVGDGSTRELTTLPNGVGRVQWATDLLGSPVVDRPAPPRPLDPRWVTAGLLAMVVAGPLALWGWRRRVRP